MKQYCTSGGSLANLDGMQCLASKRTQNLLTRSTEPLHQFLRDGIRKEKRRSRREEKDEGVMVALDVPL